MEDKLYFAKCSKFGREGLDSVRLKIDALIYLNSQLLYNYTTTAKICILPCRLFGINHVQLFFCYLYYLLSFLDINSIEVIDACISI